MNRTTPALYILLTLMTFSLYAQVSVGIGTIPFDWSGHGGLYHRYGFPGWGSETDLGPLFLDGNFAHWPKRYTFPFKVNAAPVDEDYPFVNSSLWYKKGDYALDEFAFEIDFEGADDRSTVFQALKRNFDDRLGMLGPTTFTGGGGTIQQNYRLMLNRPRKSGDRLQLQSAYFKTTDAIPVPFDLVWKKGALRSDQITTVGVRYTGQAGGMKYRLTAGTFSQRLKISLLSDVPQWRADLLSQRFAAEASRELNRQTILFASAAGSYRAISSDSLGSQTRTGITAELGMLGRSGRVSHRVGIGGTAYRGYGSSVRYRIESEYAAGRLKLHGGAEQDLHLLPFQFSGRQFLFVPDFFYPARVPTLRPDSSAVSQVRNLVRLGAAYEVKRLELEALFFVSQTAPHYFFERSHTFGGGLITALEKNTSDRILGVSWSARVNYFRNWWFFGRGVTFPDLEQGWGIGVKNQVNAGLTVQEKLFKGRLDARVKLWADVWSGRDRFVWDPILSLGYYNDEDSDFPDVTTVINVRFTGVILNLEISYTMMSLSYIGWARMKSVHASFTEEEVTAAASPLLPAAGGLTYFTFRWNFRD